MYVYDKITIIVYLVWSVCLKLSGDEFEPWLKQKYGSLVLGIFVVCGKMKS